MTAYDKKYQFWVATKEQLENVLMKQKILETMQPVGDRFTAHCVHADMYCDYVELVNKIGYIYHRTFQVQKRELLTRLLEAAGTRLCELKNELKDIELSEFVYIDRTIVQRKLSYELVQVLRPDFFPFIRNREIYDLIHNPRPTVELPLSEEEEKKMKIRAKARPQLRQSKIENKLTEEQERLRNACILIQCHERLRVTRVWKSNIKYDPKKYLPSPELFTITEGYKFSFKPDQDMLISLKRTVYDDNYIKTDKIDSGFEFYTKPLHQAKMLDLDELDSVRSRRPKSVVKEIEIEGMEGVENVEEEDEIQSEQEQNEDEHDEDEERRLKSLSSQGQKTVIFTRDELDSQATGDFEKKKRSVKSILSFKSNQEDTEVSIITSQNDSPELTIEEIQENAARKIQGVWKIFLAKRTYQKLLEKRAIFYKTASIRKPLKNPLEALFARSYELKTIKDQFMADFIKAVANEKTRIVVKHTDGIMEDISDHIRYWIRNFREITDELPPFPAEAKGGTILVLKEQTIAPREFNLNKTKTPQQIAAEAKKIRDDEKKEKKALKQKAKIDAKNEKQFMQKVAKSGNIYYDFEKIFSRNKFTKTMEAVINECNEKWWYDVDEKSNIHETPFMTWIREQKFAEIHVELRKVVDEMMRLEYEQLKEAIAIDQKKKYKPPKPPKVKKVKKPRKPKVEIDLTGDKTISELYYEMQDTGLIKKYKKRCFEEFFGDFKYCAYEMRNYFGLEVLPSTLEVRDILKEWIFGMGPLNLPKYRSILIGGPPQSAKYHLCEILASEIDAVMIDLSIEIVAKYLDDMEILINLVTKMSRILQPTVIFIENVHRTFWKKIPPEFESLNPTILSQYIHKKILATIKPNEKILILATTDEPWSGSSKMNSLFEKVILIPKTDYSSAYMFWKKMILENCGVRRDLEFAPIVHTCRDFTSGQIAENIRRTLNIERRMFLSREKLKFEEFVETFINMDTFPAPEESYDKYYKWFNRTNKMAKKRTQVMRALNSKVKK